MERGLGAVLLPDMQAQALKLQASTALVRQTQQALIRDMREASEAGVALRVIAHNVGVNHERVRRALADEIEVKPF